MLNLLHSKAAVVLILVAHSSAWAAGLPVGTVKLAEQDVAQQIRVTGTVTSPQSAALSTSVAGLIQSYLVDIGARVKAGDRLVQLDAELAQLELQAAQAREAEARAGMDEAQRRLTEAEDLADQRNIIAETEVETLRSTLAVRKAALAAARAEARRQKALVARHAIKAPFTGVISDRLAETGEWTNPGDPLLQLVATQSLQFDFRLPQDVFEKIRTDMPMTITVDPFPDLELDGRVDVVVPVSDPRDRTFFLRAVAKDTLAPATRQQIAPGMSARGLIKVNTGRRSIVVPRDGLQRYPDGRTSVWIVDDSEAQAVVREQQVVTGLEFSGVVEIRSGLKPGLLVVVRGNESLRDGQNVEVR